MTAPTFDRIAQTAFAFYASKTLLSAVELGVFTALARKGSLDLAQLTAELALHPRGARDFLDALVAMKLLERVQGRYSNSEEAALYLDRDRPEYIGGMLEMASRRLFRHWGNLTEALQTGKPQNEVEGTEEFFATLYRDPRALAEFLRAMSALTAPTAAAMAAQLPWKDYRTVIDIGTAEGALPIALARAHPHLRGGGFDLPAVRPAFEAAVAKAGLSDRLAFYEGSFFTDELPSADVLVMGHVLHDWDLAQKKMLLAKAHRALQPGGLLVVYESIIDDDRRENLGGLLASLNMLVETPGGFDYTGADGRAWFAEAGFRDVRQVKLHGSKSMLVGTA